MRRLIIEGVTGAGKSSVINCLKESPMLKNALFVSEDHTLGELFSELQNDSISPNKHLRRLDKVLIELESVEGSIVLERFHHSYYALGLDWKILRAIDERLVQFKFKTALLDMPESEFTKRSLKRVERKSEEWEQGFLKLYGNQKSAIEAFKESQQRRKDALKLSNLKCQVFSTMEMDWARTSREILSFLEAP